MSKRVNYYDNKYFSEKELQCPTSKDIVLAEGFLNCLINLRENVGEPLQITSCCRSQEHNEWLKSRGYPASPNSFHKIGNDKWGTDTCAVDIAIPNSVFRKDLVKRAIDLGWSVGVARTFIHVDRRIDYTPLPQVLYVY